MCRPRKKNTWTNENEDVYVSHDVSRIRRKYYFYGKFCLFSLVMAIEWFLNIINYIFNQTKIYSVEKSRANVFKLKVGFSVFFFFFLQL